MEHASSLLHEIRHLNKLLARLEKKQSLSRAFMAGVLSGLGSVIGATIVVALLAYLLRQVQLVPLLGDWLAQLTTEVMTKVGNQ